MQKQYALNKQLTFIIPMLFAVRSFVRQFHCVTVIKSTSNQKAPQPKGNDMQRRIKNPGKRLRWSFLRKQLRAQNNS